MVNQIETNIKQSSNYVEKAKENTEKAVTYQQKARKVQCGFTRNISDTRSNESPNPGVWWDKLDKTGKNSYLIDHLRYKEH